MRLAASWRMLLIILDFRFPFAHSIKKLISSVSECSVTQMDGGSCATRQPCIPVYEWPLQTNMMARVPCAIGDLHRGFQIVTIAGEAI